MRGNLMSKVKNRLPVKSGWLEYAKAIFTEPPYSVNQVSETKRAFYAGVQFLLHHIITLESDEYTDDDFMEHMTVLKKELDQFCRDVIEGNL
jgi:hypothetical protein